MRGFSIFLLLTCSAISIQGYGSGNTNANTNTNVNMFRRNYNGIGSARILRRDNMMSRFGYPEIRRPYYAETDYGVPMYEMPDNQLIELNGNIASVANAAARATLSITRRLADDFGESAAISVADAVARILLERSQRPRRIAVGRRNSNYNTNYNLNVMGRGDPRDFDGRATADDESPDPEATDSMDAESAGVPVRLLDAQYGRPNYGTILSDQWKSRPGPREPFYPGHGVGLSFRGHMLRDDEGAVESEPQEEGALAEEVNPEVEGSVVPEEAPEQLSEVPSVGSRLWRSRSQTNTNSNINLNSFQHRRNFNSNTNQNIFRRNFNTNSNTNINNWRRNNANVNMNSNVVDPYRY